MCILLYIIIWMHVEQCSKFCVTECILFILLFTVVLQWIDFPQWWFIMMLSLAVYRKLSVIPTFTHKSTQNESSSVGLPSDRPQTPSKLEEILRLVWSYSLKPSEHFKPQRPQCFIQKHRSLHGFLSCETAAENFNWILPTFHNSRKERCFSVVVFFLGKVGSRAFCQGFCVFQTHVKGLGSVLFAMRCSSYKPTAFWRASTKSFSALKVAWICRGHVVTFIRYNGTMLSV